jgi:Cu(I)/Ag(I) efflux system membrane fusion protein
MPPRLVLAALVAVTLAIAFHLAPWPPSAPRTARADSGLRLVAVQPEVPTGNARLAVRVVDATGAPAPGTIAVTSVRLDMAPDGMETMTAATSPGASGGAGEIAYTADLAMAGRWQLSLSATVDGKPVSGAVVFTATQAAEAQKPAGRGRLLYYRHPMGLPEVSKEPKKDSMGMDFIAVYEGDVGGPPGSVRIAPEKVQRAGVRTEIVQRRRIVRTVRGAGTVAPDESRVAVSTTKFEGFVEELLVPVTGDEVAAGQPLLRVWIESRDILQKQSDFLAALRAQPARPADIQRAENNLRLFGIPDAAIAQLRRTGEPVRVLTLTSAIGGTVMEKPAVNGMRFAAGAVLYRVADLSTVWIMAQIAERDLPALARGQKARITLRGAPDAPLAGEVAFIYPELAMAMRTATVRIVMPNADRRLHMGQYADVLIDATLGDGPVVAVPEQAVIDSGSRRVAFVAKGDGLFEPRDLELGLRGGGFVEVRSGLAEGERIVTTGNFLIDAESNLRAALQGFAPPPAEGQQDAVPPAAPAARQGAPK